MKLSSTQTLLLKLGAAKGQYRAAWRLIDIAMPEPNPLTSLSPFSSIAKSLERYADARGAIYCVAIYAEKNRLYSGSSISNWSRSRPHSKT